MSKTNLPKVSISILWPDIRAVMLFKFLVWLKFHLNLDFCCAIAPRRNKTGVDIIDQIIFFSSEIKSVQLQDVVSHRVTRRYSKKNKVAKVARPTENCCVSKNVFVENFRDIVNTII